jgi:Spy/CpxP family protein refolding chaperone
MKNRARALVVLIAVLLAGCLLGIAGHHFFERRFQASSGNSTALRGQGHQDRLAKRLQLTAEQEVQLKSILEESRRQINLGRAELEAKVEAIRSATNGRIAAILNEEQKKKFQQLMSEGESGRHAAGHSEGSGGHGRER